MNVMLFTKSRKTGRCEHPEHLRTVNYGLERTVCVRCGEVTVRDLGHSGSGELFQGMAPIHQR